MTPKISIIVPTIGRVTLKETLESLVNQSYNIFEIIVTDDTEEQKGNAIVDEIKHSYSDIKIKYSLNTKYLRGPGGNRNNGLDLAEGDYITFVDDDDVLMPNALEKALYYIDKLNLDFFLGNCIDNLKGEKTGKSYGKNEYLSHVDFLNGKYDGEYFMLARNGLMFDLRFPDDAWGAEVVLWWKVLKRADKIYYVDEIFKIYNSKLDDGRVTYQMIKHPERQVLNYYYIINEFYKDLLKYAPKQLLRYAIRGIYFSRLGKNFNFCLFFLNKSFKANKIYFSMSLAYLFFLYLLPKNLIVYLHEKILKKFATLVKKYLVTIKWKK